MSTSLGDYKRELRLACCLGNQATSSVYVYPLGGVGLKQLEQSMEYPPGGDTESKGEGRILLDQYPKQTRVCFNPLTLAEDSGLTNKW